MLARSLFTMQRVGLARSESWQLPAATYRTLASGAMPCTDSTSRVSSPYQPARRTRSARPGCTAPALYCLNWPAANGLSPTTVANWLASALMVGDA